MSKQLTKQKKEITESVLERVKQLQQEAALVLPNNYNVGNATKAAFLMLSEQNTKIEGIEKPVLQACTQVSIANSLLDMITQGLHPTRHGYFIPYRDKLSFMRNYHGSVYVAKRDSGLKDVPAQVVYEGDEFVYEVKKGRLQVIKHVPGENWGDINKIKGAYAYVTLKDGTEYIELMNIKQIRTAWQQGATKGNSKAHNNFTDEMCKRTVINRATKELIKTSSDNFTNDDPQENTIDVQPAGADSIEQNANAGATLTIDVSETIDKEEAVEGETVNAEVIDNDTPDWG